jgi:sulfur-oxidizing protein SoxA
MLSRKTLSRLRGVALALAGAASAFGPLGTAAQSGDETLREIERYRQALLEGNPAELVAMRGQELWKTPRGPKKVSLEKCDLGLGPGVVKGAYAQLPRYFADADQVMDFETRLVHCMVTLQGFERADAVKIPYSGAGQRQTDIEAITAYVVEESRGMPVAVPQKHPKERASYDRGKRLFYMRAGPYDFACSTCHGVDNQRIRLQDLPNFEKAEPAQRAFTTWPAYRVSQGALRTMQWRLNDCFRQQRWPEPIFASQGTIDLITFLGVKAAGGKMDSPAIKR